MVNCLSRGHGFDHGRVRQKTLELVANAFRHARDV